MENTIGRSRNLRNSYYYQKKRGSYLDDKSISKIIKQLIISAAIFVVFLTVKNLNMSGSHALSTRVSQALTYDAELGSVVETVKKFVSGISVTNDKLRSVFSSNGLISDVKISEQIIPEDMKEKITDGAELKDKNFQIPLEGILVSGFGERISPISGEKEFHEGVDLNAKEKQEIKAVLDGTILEAKNSPSLGNYVRIKHEDDIYTLYAHASEVNVKEGQSVKKGDVIAKAGNTGNSTGVHLHFEMWHGEKIINPQTIFDFK